MKSVNKYIFIRNLMLGLMVCNLLYWLFPIAPVFWRILMVALSLCVILVDREKRLPCEVVLLAFIALNVLYYFLSFIRIVPSTTQIGDILCAFLSLFVFSSLAKKNVITNSFFIVTGILLTVASIFYYYQEMRLFIELNNDTEGWLTINATVLFLFLLPMLFFIKSSFVKWLLLLVCLFFIISGSKRGNLLAAVIPIILFVYYEFRDNRQSILKWLFISIILVFGSYLVYKWTISNDYLMFRYERTLEGDSSHRDVIFTNAWNLWYHSDIISIIFGHGFDGTINNLVMGGARAHNDWLEILVDYGLLGGVLYFLVFMSFVIQTMRTKSFLLRSVLISSLSIWFLKSLYSMGFSEGNMYILMISMGTALGQGKRINNKRSLQ